MNPYFLLSQTQLDNLPEFAARCRYCMRGIAIVSQDAEDDWFETKHKLPALAAHDPFEGMTVCFVDGEFDIPEIQEEAPVSVDAEGITQIEEALSASPYSDMDEVAAGGMVLLRKL